MNEYQSQDITKLAKALLSVQKTLQPAVKDATNPFVKNRYASLNSVMDVCKEPLLSNGIWLCQHPVPVENQEQGQTFMIGLVTKLTHAESGQWQSSLTVVPLPKADPQGMGSAITYARRYALSAMLGIVTEEDNDGEYGTKPKSQANKSVPSYKDDKSDKGVRKASKTKESNQVNLPVLDGVVYESLAVQDDKGNSREIITASGNTIPNKNQLMQEGFKWNPNKKIWWKYSE